MSRSTLRRSAFTLLFLCTPVLECTLLEGRVKLPSSQSLWYCVHRPELLIGANKPPLVVLHGGLQVPSDYLFGLQDLDDQRAVVFYDQLGCGRSDRPESPGEYSVDSAVQDLCAVLSHLEVGARYHLYGQSWGGLLAYLLLSTSSVAVSPPLSLTLSNSPASVSLVEAEAARLIKALDGSAEAFMATHNCRAGTGDEQPAPIADAYAHAGTSWRGSGVIAELAVDVGALGAITTPTLVLRGEFDFVTEACVEPWRALPSAEFVTLANASHHALIEEPDSYMQVLSAHLCKHDK